MSVPGSSERSGATVIGPSAHSASYRASTALVAPGQLRVARREHGDQSFDEAHTAAHQLGARLHQLLVEHVECRPVVAVADTRAQQRVAVPQHALEVAARGVVAGRETAQQIVEEVAAVGRTALHELQVVGREHGDAQQAREIARAGQAIAVEQHPIGTDGTDGDLEQLPALPLGHLDAEDRLAAAGANERGVGNATKRTGRARPIRSPRARSSSRRRWLRTAP